MKLLRVLVCALFIVSVCVFGYFKFTGRKDATVPVISCKEEKLTISVKDSEKKLLGYVTASDEKDGDLSDRIFIENMTPYISSGRTDITFVVCDSDNHVGRLTVPAYYSDYHTPHFVIKKPLIVPLRERGFSISKYIGVDDCIDGSELAQSLITVTDLDLTKAGRYALTVKATNSRFDSSVIDLSVTVIDEAAANPVMLSKYIVYCTAGDQLDFASFIDEDEKTEVTVNDSDADLKTPGVYEVLYSTEGKNDTRLVVVCEEAEK